MIVFIPPFTSPRSISSCPTFYPCPTSIYYFISTPFPLWADPEMDVLPLSNYQCTHARAGCTSNPTTVAVRRRPWRVITLVPERFSSKKATSIYHFTLGPCKGCSLFMSLWYTVPFRPIVHTLWCMMHIVHWHWCSRPVVMRDWTNFLTKLFINLAQSA